MQIIIVGCGKVGYSIAKILSEEDNNVTIVDKNNHVLEKATNALDVMCVRGNGMSASILNQAGAAEADLIICVTNADEINMLCCLTAKKLGVKRTIARIRDPEYAHELYLLKQDIGLDMVINPEQEAAREIARLVRFPTANEIDTFVHGRVEMASFRITEKDLFVGKKIWEIFQRVQIPVLFGLIERDGETIIPKGNLIIQEEDIVYVIGRADNVTAFFKDIGKFSEKINSAFIVGGGKISHYLIEILLRMSIKVKVIEMDYEKCEALNEKFPKALIVHGDGTDEDLLNSEYMDKMDAVICLTDHDEENLMLALYAVRCNVYKVIAKINTINYNGLVRDLGVESIISPKMITTYQIVRYVRSMQNTADSSIETLHKVADMDVEAIEFNVAESAKCVNILIKDIKLKAGILIACIVRKGKIIMPVGSDEIMTGDNVIILAKGHNITEINDILEY